MAELVFAYGAPPLPFGSVHDLDEFGAYVLYQGVDPLNLSVHEGKHYLLVARPFDPVAEIEIPAPPLPFGDAGDGTGQAIVVAGQTVPIWPAATFGLSTRPDDTPADLYIPGKLAGGINFTVDLFAGADPLSEGQAGFGELALVDPEGDLDPLLSLGWDGARLQLKRGSRETLLADWEVVASLTAAQPPLADLRTKKIDIRDLTWKMSQAELHGQRWTGTGGANGDARLAGQVIPYAAGHVFNATPVLESAVDGIYRVSTGRVRGITAVRDGGQAYAFHADYPSWDALKAALDAGAIPAGHYGTARAVGRFALGSAPVKDITCDIEGDDETIDGQSFPQTRGQIARRIATRLGAVRLDEVSEFDFAALMALESAQPAPVGFYWSDPAGLSKSAALTEVMRGCMGWWTVRVNGLFAVGFIDDPEAGSPEFVLEYPAAGAGERRLGEPSILVTLPPRRATYVGFRRNYTQQAPSSLASGLGPSEVALYGATGRYAGCAELWTANSYPSSPAVYVEGNYRNETDAAAEAFRQQSIWNKARSLYSVPAIIDPLADLVGRRGRIDNLNRLGFGAMKRLLCSGIESPANPKITLKLWG